MKTRSDHPEPGGGDNCTEDCCGDRVPQDREREQGRQKASGARMADVTFQIPGERNVDTKELEKGSTHAQSLLIILSNNYFRFVTESQMRT